MDIITLSRDGEGDVRARAQRFHRSKEQFQPSTKLPGMMKVSHKSTTMQGEGSEE